MNNVCSKKVNLRKGLIKSIPLIGAACNLDRPAEALFVYL